MEKAKVVGWCSVPKKLAGKHSNCTDCPVFDCDWGAKHTNWILK